MIKVSQKIMQWKMVKFGPIYIIHRKLVKAVWELLKNNPD